MAEVIKNLKIQNFELRTFGSGARIAVTLYCYKPSCFSRVNDHFHGLVSMRIPRFVHEKQEGL